MFSSGRLSKLIERFTGGGGDGGGEGDHANGPTAAAAGAAASSASPAPPAAHPDSGQQQPGVTARGGGRGGGRGRGGRGGGDANHMNGQRPQSARLPLPADDPSSSERGGGGRGRGSRGGGRGGGGQRRGGGQAQESESADAAGHDAGGPPRQRQPRNRNNARPASAHPSSSPSPSPGTLDAAAAPFVPGASPPNNDSFAAASNPSQARGPSKKQLAAQQAAAAAAAERARLDAELDSPSNPLNIPSAALATELRLLAMRYNKSFKQEQFRSSMAVSLSFAPSDPDFPFELPPEQLHLQFLFHDISLYPYAPLPAASGTNDAQLARLQARVQVRCLNDERHVPAYMREAVESALHYFICHTQFGVPQLLRNALKMLDREVTDWLQLAQRKQNAKVERTLAKLMGPAAAAKAMADAAAAAAAPALPDADDTAASEQLQAASSPDSTAASLPSVSPSSSPAADSSSSAAAASTAAAAPVAVAVAAEPEDEWSPAQQSSLESALKSVPRTLGSAERWDAIAAAVEGKTKKQVLARYKKIAAAVKSGGGAAAAADAAGSAPTAASAAAAASASAAAVIAAPPLAAMSLSRSNAQDVDPDETAAIHAARIRDQQIERRFEAMQMEEARLEEEERAMAKGGKPNKKKKKSAPQSTDERKHDSEHGSDSDGSDDSSHASGESDDEVFEPVTERISLNPLHRGTQLLMVDLEMSGLGILKSSSLRVEVLCVRCETRGSLAFGPANGASNPVVERCARCGIHHSLKYRSEMVHEHSDSLGYVDLENCELFDVTSVDLFGTCIADECFTEAAMRGLQRGRTFESNCRHCHTRLACRFEQIEIARITPAALIMEEPKGDSRGRKAAARIDPAEVAAAKNRVKEQALLKLGTPLPNKGACKHYKRSYRWMRFPCCGKAYPCDVCHEEAEGHSGEWATRMICGNCSKEQPFSSKACVHCGLAFSTVAKTFWEGGSGMRDRKRLSRNDSRKHAGLAKTKSAKENRVGKKAAKDTPHKSSRETTGNTA